MVIGRWVGMWLRQAVKVSHLGVPSSQELYSRDTTRVLIRGDDWFGWWWWRWIMCLQIHLFMSDPLLWRPHKSHQFGMKGRFITGRADGERLTISVCLSLWPTIRGPDWQMSVANWLGYWFGRDFCYHLGLHSFTGFGMALKEYQRCRGYSPDIKRSMDIFNLI